MATGEIAAYLSLALAVVFWVLSTKQANDAKKTLGDIKTEIITWQAQLNKAAINIISSRPEVIAKETAIEETKSLSEFSTQLLDLIKNASSNPLPKESGGAYQLEVLDKLLAHHKTLILGKQELMNQAIASQAGVPYRNQNKA
ncbi:MAG: hypothetical protein U9N18_03955 [Campylobacterota bacterium]|nr:hypothetical protein [Campylobacterota bacterium]MEA2066004.1 hypothetical protein [Thermotogota bacterium]